MVGPKGYARGRRAEVAAACVGAAAENARAPVDSSNHTYFRKSQAFKGLGRGQEQVPTMVATGKLSLKPELLDDFTFTTFN